MKTVKIAGNPWLQLSKKRFLLSIFTLALVSTTASLAAANQFETNQLSASVAGTITDQRGDPIPGATVSLTQPSAEEAKTALADQDGSFLISADAGSFDFQVSMSGFATKSIHGGLSVTAILDLGKIELPLKVQRPM